LSMRLCSPNADKGTTSQVRAFLSAHRPLRRPSLRQSLVRERICDSGPLSYLSPSSLFPTFAYPDTDLTDSPLPFFFCLSRTSGLCRHFLISPTEPIDPPAPTEPHRRPRRASSIFSPLVFARSYHSRVCLFFLLVRCAFCILFLSGG